MGQPTTTISVVLPTEGTGYRQVVESIAGDLYLLGLREIGQREAFESIRDAAAEYLAELEAMGREA